MALPKEILDAEWIKGNDHTMIRYADERKRIHIIPAGMNPYFFIKEEDLEKAKKFFDNRVVKVERGKYVTITGHKAVKISVRYPSDIKPRKGKGLRDILEKHGIETFESDIPFVRRWMIDNDIKQCKISWKCYVDIECDARSGFPDPNEAPFRVLSISVSGNDGKQYFFCDDDEKKMLKEFFGLIKKCYHMITGWNIRRFDWPYLINRAKKLGININFTPIQEIDAMLNYEKLCLWEEMPVLTPMGEVPIKNIGYFTGFKPCIAAKVGDVIFVGSYDQPLLTPTGWKALKDIKPGDKVLTILSTNAQLQYDNYDKAVRILWEKVQNKSTSKKVLQPQLLLEVPSQDESQA